MSGIAVTRFALAAIILFCISVNVFAAASRDEIQIFRLVNSERARRNLEPLQWNDQLASIARNYSTQMARESFFDHYDRGGRTVIHRAMSAGISHWKKIGENLFFCQGDVEISGFAVKGWMNSSGHRRNILDQKWTATGIGLARARNGKIYVTEIFVQN